MVTTTNPRDRSPGAPAPARPGRAFLPAVRGAALVAAVFCAAVLVLLLLNRAMTVRADPLNDPALLERIREASAHPDRADLVDSVRAWDLLARRAFFDAQAFARAGARLLLAGAVVLLAALKAERVLDPPPPAVPGAPRPEAEVRRRRRERWGIAVAAAALLGLPALLREPPPAAAPPGLPEPSTPAAPVPAAFADDARMAANWPCFRGFGSRGVAETAAPPLQWNGATGDGVAWKTGVPRPGFSSPVVWDDLVFLTGADAEARELFAFDAGTGALRWRAVTDPAGGGLPEVTADTGYAAPTPATDGRRVYALFASGELLACRLDGTRAWTRHLGVPDNPYGHASSLVTWRHLLIVQLDDRANPRVMALDGATGEEVWSQARLVEPSWATPLPVPMDDGSTLLVLSANPAVAAYDAATGAERWSAGELPAEVGASPARLGRVVFAGNEYAGLHAIDAASGEVLWTVEDDLPDASSPAAAGGLLFVPTAYGAVSCLDAATGERVWEHLFDEGFYASPVVAAGRVYLTDTAGVTHVFDATRVFEERAASPLGEGCVATPAFAGGRVYLRGRKHLFAIGPAGETAP